MLSLKPSVTVCLHQSHSPSRGAGENWNSTLPRGPRLLTHSLLQQQDRLLELRRLLRDAAPVIASQFAGPLRDKYAWLLGEALATRVLAEGWTTTNGRVMGRAAGYTLDPHLDSAHFGVTCLLYFSEAVTPEDGALGLYRPDRQPEVLDASTYYPDKAEGIASTLVTSIPVRPNLFVAFVCSPVSLHGFGRAAGASGWRFVYQCHVMPRHFQIDQMLDQLDDAHRARWAKYLPVQGPTM